MLRVVLLVPLSGDDSFALEQCHITLGFRGFGVLHLHFEDVGPSTFRVGKGEKGIKRHEAFGV